MAAATIPDASELREKALDYIKSQRPKSHRQMQKDGELDLYLDTTVENCQRLANNLIESGMSEDKAWDQAIKMEIYESEE